MSRPRGVVSKREPTVSEIRARFRRAEAAHNRADEYRRTAAEHAKIAEASTGPAARETERQLSEAYRALAKEEDWLAGRIAPDV
jgi:hypothetical protein